MITENSDWLRYANSGATRNHPVSHRLSSALSFLPEMGVTMEVFSGGQPKAGGGPRVGSTRHDHGEAADVFFYKNGRRLDWADPRDRPIFQDIVRRAKANGVTGFGAGEGYMQPGSMHIGFGDPAVWGAGGKGANAPRWLREAYDGSVQVADASANWTPEQRAAIARAQAKRAAREGKTKFTPEQEAALARARARREEAKIAAERDSMTHKSSGSSGRALSPAEKFAAARDAAVYKEHPIASGVATAISGLPFIGEGIDEFAGMIGGEDTRGAMQAGIRGFRDANPALATIIKGGTGLGSAVAGAAAVAPAVAAVAPAGVGMQALTGLGAGALLGAIEGGTTGYLAEEGDARIPGAFEGAVTGGTLGASVGAIAPVVSSGTRNAARYARFAPDASAARSMGVSPPSAEIVGRMLQNDDPARIAAEIAKGGDAAMIGDAGPMTSGLMDAAAINAGPAGQIARRAIDQRAAEAGQEITSALDQFLGKPRGLKAAARDISGRTAQIRQQAYDRAYAAPIDYASPQGRAIEDVLSRIPPEEMIPAIREANNEMLSFGIKNRQVMAQIDDGGNVVFQEMPDVRQLDYLKRALDKKAAESVNPITGQTLPAGVRPSRLARELRKALGDAVPEYNRAVSLGGQKIAEDKALDAGRRILQVNFSREDVADALDGASPELLRQAKIGLRRQVEEVMANVRRSIGDTNMDAREGVKAMAILSSRSTREKLEIVLGKADAKALTERIDRAARSFELRARLAENSKTEPRRIMNEEIRKLTNPSAVGELLSASPGAAAQKLVRSMTQMTPEARTQIEERILGEIATLLTGPRGAQAQAQAQRLVGMLSRSQATEVLAQRIGRAAGVTVGAGGYQAGSQTTRMQRTPLMSQ